MSFSVRQANIDDLDVISEYNVNMAQETEDLALPPDVVRKGVDAILRDPAKGTYFVIQSGEKVVAQLMITYEWSDWYGRFQQGEYSVYVHPESRGQGFFRILYKHVRDEAMKVNAGGLRLYVDSHNTRAQAVYEAMGMSSHYLVYEEEFSAKQ